MSVLAMMIYFVITAPAGAFVGPISVIAGPFIIGSMSFGPARVAQAISRSPKP